MTMTKTFWEFSKQNKHLANHYVPLDRTLMLSISGRS